MSPELEMFAEYAESEISDTISLNLPGEPKIGIEYYAPTTFWQEKLEIDEFLVAYPTFYTSGNGKTAVRELEDYLLEKALKDNITIVNVIHPTTGKAKKFFPWLLPQLGYSPAFPREGTCYYRLFEG